MTDCGVIGVHSKDASTELPRAYVTIADGDETNEQVAQELKEFVEKQVADHMKLRGGLYIVKSLPMTGSGKVQRQQLAGLNQESIVAFA